MASSRMKRRLRERGVSKEGLLDFVNRELLPFMIELQRSGIITGASTFDVMQYGARGDGVADDTAAINACFADAQAAATVGRVRGTRVYFPSGVYNFTALDPLTIGLEIYGDGINRSMIRCTSETAQNFIHCISCVPNIHDLQTFNLHDNLAHVAIRLTNCTNFSIDRLKTTWDCTAAGRHLAGGILVEATAPHLPPVGSQSHINNIEIDVEDSHGIPWAPGSFGVLLRGIPAQAVFNVSLGGSSNIENGEYGIRLEYASIISFHGSWFLQGNNKSFSTFFTQNIYVQGLYSASPHGRVHIEETDENTIANLYVHPAFFNPNASGVTLQPSSRIIQVNTGSDCVMDGTEFRKNSLSTDNTTRAVRASNATPGTNPTPNQNSPLITMEGNSYDAGTLGNKSFLWGLYGKSIAGNPADSMVVLVLSVNGAASSDIWQIGSDGSLRIGEVIVGRSAVNVFRVEGVGGSPGSGVLHVTSGNFLTPNGAGAGLRLGDAIQKLFGDVVFRNIADALTVATMDSTGLVMTGKLALTVAGQIVMPEMTPPGVPAAGTQFLYIDSGDQKLKRRQSDGTVVVIA